MKVRAVFVQEFYEYIGKPFIDIELPEGASVRTLIEVIDKRVKSGFRDLVLDDKGELRYPVSILVNGRRIEFLDGLETRLKDGDRVFFSPRALFVL
ncbi:hypothetical protein Pyrfu_1807 [Pyrolobus fumarii 1A]|uniref:MoaD family protein n=1 Tax=Pyrolobus fumarii (strain DSM 11204 / 1A) TaxID=694429 RepID=G0ECU1_PYRF1|nr:MoaD/ThiS family protein [Pyrolobus fumarii]AEM39661.1 hypothetical protein Pyrfu_1807 [Pyrolobus fumarii 1A]